MIKFLSTFTGVGGLEWGLEKMKTKCVGFSEIKDSSIRIYNSHYPGRVNFGDIIKMDYKVLPDFDLMTGGFPCQAFSLAGAREGFKNRKGQLIFYIYDLLVAKKPEYIVLENVKGLLIHNKKQTFKNVVELLQNAGYYIRVILLNSANYGSAQSRERLIFLGRRSNDFELKNPEVIDDTKRFRNIRDVDKNHFTYIKTTPRNLLKINQRDLYPFDVVGGYDRVGTITTGVSGGGGRNPSSQQKIVQELDGRWRYLTPVEAERLQGFPDNWTEGESITSRWFAMGNAVNCSMSDYLFNNYLKEVWKL